MLRKTWAVVGGVVTALAMSGIAFASTGSLQITVNHDHDATVAGVPGGPWKVSAPPGSYHATEGSHRRSYTGTGPQIKDPASSGKLTAEQQGTLAIHYSAQNNGYEAVWHWSGIKPGQQVMLIGDIGSTVSTMATPKTLLFGTASKSGGSATIFIPAKDYYATAKTPETFEMLALFGSIPTGQLPEVPYAAGIPLAALGVGVVLWRRQGRMV